MDLARFAVLNIGANFENNNETDALKLYQLVQDYAKTLGGSVTRTSNFISIYTDRLQEAILKNNAIFLVNEVMEVKSLLDESKYDHSLRTIDKDFLEIANKTNLSIQTLSKINFSRRSAQRILKVLLETNLANIIGEEQPYLKGRPVPLYRILI